MSLLCRIVFLSNLFYIFSREQLVRSVDEHNVWLNGIAVYTPKVQVIDNFRRTYLSMDDRMVDLTREASPAGDVSHPGYYHATYDLYPSLEDSTCTSYSLAPQGIIFDSVVSAAKGYCRAKRQRCGDHVNICNISLNIIEQELVSEASTNNTRVVSLSTGHYIWNIQRKVDNDNDVLRYIRCYEMLSSVWVQIQPFIYSNGSLFPPEDLRLVAVVSYSVSPQIKLFVNILSGLGILFCAICSWVVHNNRNHHVFQSFGPVFYHIQCIGSSLVLLGCSISNIDDTYGFEQSFLDMTCNLRTILRVCGFLLMFVTYILKVMFLYILHVCFYIRHCVLRKIV